MKKNPFPMIKSLCLFIAIFVFQSFNGYSLDNCEQAEIKFEEAKNLAINNKADEALLMIDSCINLCQNTIKYKFEKALLYYQKEDFENAKKILIPLADSAAADDQVYQILGICYELTRYVNEAEATYLKGLRKYPKSGKLYCELGTFYQPTKPSKQFLLFWEKGIQVEPTYAMNYYPLSIFYCRDREKLWGLIYSEIYLNIANNAAKTKELSTKMYDTYNQALNAKEGGKLFPKFSAFTPTTHSRNIDSIQVNFNGAYHLVMKDVLENYELKDSTVYSIKQISNIRTNFINLWFKYGFNKKYQNTLFDYDLKLINAGLFEAYNYLLLKEGNNKEFDEWYKKGKDGIKNKSLMEELFKLMLAEPLVLNDKNFVSKYKNDNINPVHFDNKDNK
jgi:hypothetical protein